MNVYVRELCTALARTGNQCDVFTRSWDPDLPSIVPVEPGFRVHHVPAGPQAPVAKSDLGALVEDFADAVARRVAEGPWYPHLSSGAAPGGHLSSGGHAFEGEATVDAIHAHYWLSGAAGHILKHRLDVPLISTFHTLERVKEASGASDGADDPRRIEVETQVIGCSDAVLAPNPPEAHQLVSLYGAQPDRVRIVAPGVDHAFFSPGDRAQARRALGLPVHGRMLLFMGRIQALKGVELTVGALDCLDRSDTFLVIAGGPSGAAGELEMDRLVAMVADAGLRDRVHFFPPQPHEMVSTFCRAADVCLVPSRSESFGLVALEAGACGVPVVASAVGGLRTLILDRRTGVLVEERRPEAYAEAIEWVLASPARAGAMARMATANARRYTWRMAAVALEALHSDLADRQLVECA